jgi:hypothetical protein
MVTTRVQTPVSPRDEFTIGITAVVQKPVRFAGLQHGAASEIHAIVRGIIRVVYNRADDLSDKFRWVEIRLCKECSPQVRFSHFQPA